MGKSSEGFLNHIEAVAHEIRSACCQSPFEVLNPFELAEMFDIKVVTPQDIPMKAEIAEHLLRADPRSWSAGTLHIGNNKYVVVINPTHAKTRQNVTLMEELVHVKLWHKPSQLLSGNNGLSRTFHKGQEREAYSIAAAALLPRRALKGAKSLGWTSEDVAEKHQVSRSLVQYRENVSGVKLLKQSAPPPFHADAYQQAELAL